MHPRKFAITIGIICMCSILSLSVVIPYRFTQIETDKDISALNDNFLVIEDQAQDKILFDRNNDILTYKMWVSTGTYTCSANSQVDITITGLTQLFNVDISPMDLGQCPTYFYTIGTTSFTIKNWSGTNIMNFRWKAIGK